MWVKSGWNSIYSWVVEPVVPLVGPSLRVKFWQLINYLNTNICLLLCSTHIHNMQLHMYWRTICEFLVKIQYFRHKWSSIIYKNTKKHDRVKEHSISCRRIWNFYLQIEYTIYDWWRSSTSYMDNRQVYTKFTKK